MCLGTVPYLLYQDVTQAHCSSSLQLEIWCLDISGKNDSVIFVVVVVVDLDRIVYEQIIEKKYVSRNIFFEQLTEFNTPNFQDHPTNEHLPSELK